MDRLESMAMVVAAVDAGSLSAAGRKLGVPLATVSRKVSELERHLQTRLFTRATMPTQADVDHYLAQVQEIRKGVVPPFQDLARRDLLGSGPNVSIPATLAVLAAEFAPQRESIFPVPREGVGASAANDFNARLRLTNLARAGYSFSDYPLPGSFTTTAFLAHFGAGIGRLDFNPRKGAPVCAEPGPSGMQPPCIPSPGQAVPGDIGANPLSDTLPDWIIARMGPGGLDLPAFETHPTAEQR